MKFPPYLLNSTLISTLAFLTLSEASVLAVGPWTISVTKGKKVNKRGKDLQEMKVIPEETEETGDPKPLQAAVPSFSSAQLEGLSPAQLGEIVGGLTSAQLAEAVPSLNVAQLREAVPSFSPSQIRALPPSELGKIVSFLTSSQLNEAILDLNPTQLQAAVDRFSFRNLTSLSSANLITAVPYYSVNQILSLSAEQLAAVAPYIKTEDLAKAAPSFFIDQLEALPPAQLGEIVADLTSDQLAAVSPKLAQTQIAATPDANAVAVAALTAAGVAVNVANVAAADALNTVNITPTAANVPTTIAALNELKEAGIHDENGVRFAADPSNIAAVTKLGGLGDLAAINALPRFDVTHRLPPIAVDALNINAAKLIGVASLYHKAVVEVRLSRNIHLLNKQLQKQADYSKAFRSTAGELHNSRDHISYLWKSSLLNNEGVDDYSNLSRLTAFTAGAEPAGSNIDIFGKGTVAQITKAYQNVALNAAKNILQGPLGVNWVVTANNFRIEHVEELEQHLRLLATDEKDASRSEELTQHADALRIVIAKIKTSPEHH